MIYTPLCSNIRLFICFVLCDQNYDFWFLWLGAWCSCLLWTWSCSVICGINKLKIPPTATGRETYIGQLLTQHHVCCRRRLLNGHGSELTGTSHHTTRNLTQNRLLKNALFFLFFLQKNRQWAFCLNFTNTDMISVYVYRSREKECIA